MAISINKYVNITSQFPDTNPVGRAFGGLVFSWSVPDVDKWTKDKGLPADEIAELKKLEENYNNGEAVQLTLAEIGYLFGDTVDDSSSDSGDEDVEYYEEYAFALRYYNYLSPSNRFASRLAFAKVQDGEECVAAFTRVCESTNMFGSFTFLSMNESDDGSLKPGSARLAQMMAVAGQNQIYDTRFLFVVTDVKGDQLAADIVEAKSNFTNFKGVSFICGNDLTSSCMPMAILGATDFDNGSVTNYMFKTFPYEEPTVRGDALYATFVNNNINFYGRTQNNGQTFDFYQRGFNTDGTDTSIYCNEMWLKAECTTQLFALLMGQERVPADDVGAAMVQMSVLEACSGAFSNGMFQTKTLSAAQQLSILQLIEEEGLSGSDYVEAITQDIAINGYAVLAFITSSPRKKVDVLAPAGEYFARYIIFYGTGDSIRYVEGTHTLLR